MEDAAAYNNGILFSGGTKNVVCFDSVKVKLNDVR